MDPQPSLPQTTRASLAARWRRWPANVRGVLLVSVGAFVMVCMAALVKHLGQRLPVFEILFVRCLAGFLFILPVVAKRGFGVVRTRRPLMHFNRGFVGTMGNACLFYAVVHMAMADAVTIQFSRPLFMIVIAALFLGDVAGWGRGLATAAGFAGILMITRPFGDDFEPVALVAVAGTLFGTMVVLTVKLLTRTEGTVTIMFYFSIWTTVLSAIPAFVAWVQPSATEFALLILTGFLGIVGQAMFTHGIGTGETTVVMPFDYLRIIYAALIGMAVFAEVPGPWSIAGAAVIMASSLYIVRTGGKRTGRG